MLVLTPIIVVLSGIDLSALLDTWMPYIKFGESGDSNSGSNKKPSSGVVGGSMKQSARVIVGALTLLTLLFQSHWYIF